MWGAKIDLHNAYFQLKLAQELKPFVRMQVAVVIYEFQASCFGLNVLPHLWQSVMNTFVKKW